MNSRQRILAAVGHRQPDRVPIGPSFSPEILQKLQNHLGLDATGVREWSGNDFAGVGPAFRGEASPVHYADPTIEVTADGCYLDIYRVPFQVVRTQFQQYVDIAGRPPLRGATSLAEIDAHPWPNPWPLGSRARSSQ